MARSTIKKTRTGYRVYAPAAGLSVHAVRLGGKPGALGTTYQIYEGSAIEPRGRRIGAVRGHARLMAILRKFAAGEYASTAMSAFGVTS